jgi:fructokinase
VAGPALAGVDLRVADAAGLFVGAETLVGAEDREITMRARSVALEHDVPVVFHPAVAVGEWRSAADAAASLNAVVPGALLVSVSAAEATLMTGEDDVERAALALVKAGARLVVVRDAEGAVLRGELRADAESEMGALGAAEVFCGTLLARLALSDFYPPVVTASLRDALAAAARG